MLSAVDSRVLLPLRRKKTTRKAMTAITAVPPTAPPIIAPIGVELPLAFSEGASVDGIVIVVGLVVTVANVVKVLLVGVGVNAVIGTAHLGLKKSS